MRAQHYTLIGQSPVPCFDLIEWATWFQSSDRRVAITKVGDFTVSTVFLGLDHNYKETGEPILFETMVFGESDSIDDYGGRCSTWLEAERLHAEVVSLVRAIIEVQAL